MILFPGFASGSKKYGIHYFRANTGWAIFAQVLLIVGAYLATVPYSWEHY